MNKIKNKADIMSIEETIQELSEYYKDNQKEIKNSAKEIENICNNIKSVLIEKNKRYGNSALEPLEIFAKHKEAGSIGVRIDDKLSRVKNSDNIRKNDIFDIIGYLTLLSVKLGWENFDDMLD